MLVNEVPINLHNTLYNSVSLMAIYSLAGRSLMKSLGLLLWYHQLVSIIRTYILTTWHLFQNRPEVSIHEPTAISATEVNGTRCCIGPCMLNVVVHLPGREQPWFILLTF